MKSLIAVCFFLLVATLATAQPPKISADPGMTYGAATTPDNAVSIKGLQDIMAKKDESAVKVKGKVVDVCPKKGCWVTLETPDQSKVFVKMKDYGFFVPTELIGKNVVIDGEAKLVETSVEELRHYAEDAKKSPEEIAAITAPKKEIRLTAAGILVTQ
jgi:hypothetical protein